MIFESLHCRPFGPFRDRTLDLAPGLNVIHGPNESGKSTLRAALSVGLCGQRRGRRPTKAVEEFKRRHQPWDDSSAWAVSVVIALADGQRVELLQDLAHGVDSSAREVDSHRDLSDQVMTYGAPDGAQWLGLSRATFDSVAGVRQAEILAILDDAGTLQEDMQRAAATARAKHTARAAVDLLTEFRRDQVGTSRSPTKPLRRSQHAATAAEEKLHAARKRHDDHRSTLDEIRAMEEEERKLLTRRRTVDAILAKAKAEAAIDRYGDALESSRLFPHGQPAPPGHDEEDGLEESLSQALRNWKSAPDPRPLEGLTAKELRERIAASERREAAYRAVGLEIELVNMRKQFERASALQKQFPDGAPRAPAGSHGDLERRAAIALSAWRSSPEPEPLGGVSSGRIAARIQASREQERLRAAVRAEVEAREHRRDLAEAARLDERVRSAPGQRPDEHEPIEREVVEALRRWEEKPDSDPPSGSSEPDLVKELDEVDQEAMTLAEGHEAAEVLRRHPLLYVVAVSFTVALIVSLVTGSVAGWVASAVLAAYGIRRFVRALRLGTAERQRRREDLAARRRGLERAITVRRVDDQAYERDCRKIERAEQTIREVAGRIKSDSTNAAEPVESLRTWLEARRRDRDAFDAVREERARLDQMTDGRSVADLEAECDALDRAAKEVAVDLDADRLETARAEPLSDEDWERFRRTATSERETWSAERAERVAAETAYQKRVEDRMAAGNDLMEVAGLADIEADDPETAAAELNEWQSRRTERQKNFDRHNRDWGTLRALLEQRTLDEFAQELADRQRELEMALSDTSEERVVAVRTEAPTPERRESLQREEQRLRKGWSDALASRRTQEHDYEAEVARRQNLAQVLIDVANAAGAKTTDPTTASRKVREWLVERQAQHKRYENLREEWGRYQEKIEGVTLAGLEREAKKAAAEAEKHSAGRDNDLYEELRRAGPTAVEKQRDKYEGEWNDLRRDLDRARGESKQVEKTLPDLIELEEALEVAMARRDRVQRLHATLGNTIRFLEQAEERVHRNIAPILRRGVRRGLSRITGGRYSDCRVDPKTLAIRVCGDEKRWRPAEDLSRGTAEQIYLLLRVTLAEHLGNPDEPCPLILDDPTASSDPDRRDAVLNTLLEIAAERQVVVFTHDPGVRDWAERHLVGDSRHHIEPLSTDEIPA